MSPSTSLVPPLRLGTLLRQARVAAGLELSDLAAAGPLSLIELDDVEQGRADLDGVAMTELMRLYGVEDTGLVPARSELVIDLDEGRIAMSAADVQLEAHRGPDAVLARYLALVYRLRDLPIGSTLELRDVDLGVLSTALELDAEDIEVRLRKLMAEGSEIETDQRRIRRQLVIPLVGVVIAVTAVGTLLLVREDSPPRRPEAVTTVIEGGAPRVADASIATAPGIDSDLGPGAAVATAGEVETDLGAGAAVTSTGQVETDLGNGAAVVENPEAG